MKNETNNDNRGNLFQNHHGIIWIVDYPTNHNFTKQNEKESKKGHKTCTENEYTTPFLNIQLEQKKNSS